MAAVDQIKLFSALFTASMVVCIVGFVLAVALFFIFKIPLVFAQMTGREQAKFVKSMRERYDGLGEEVNTSAGTSGPFTSGGLTGGGISGAISGPVSGSVSAKNLKTGGLAVREIDPGDAATSLLNGEDAATSLLSEEEKGTELLSNSSEETQQEPAPKPVVVAEPVPKTAPPPEQYVTGVLKEASAGGAVTTILKPRSEAPAPAPVFAAAAVPVGFKIVESIVWVHTDETIDED